MFHTNCNFIYVYFIHYLYRIPLRIYIPTALYKFLYYSQIQFLFYNSNSSTFFVVISFRRPVVKLLFEYALKAA